MRLITLFVTSSLLCSAASPLEVVKDASKTGMDTARLAMIPRRLKTFVDKGAAAGFVMLVAMHGQAVAMEAVGCTDMETKQPMKRMRFSNCIR